MPKYGYLVVEGPHDIEFVYRLLSPFGLKRVRLESELDPFFSPLIPRQFPPDGDLQKRMPIPLFLQSPTHVVAVHSSVGDTRLVQTLEENKVVVKITSFTGIGILLDSDLVISPADRYASLCKQLQAKGFTFPDEPGVIKLGPPRLGAFVLPDNNTNGTLENLLIECASSAYPTLLNNANEFVSKSLRDTTLTLEDLRDSKKPSGQNKAIIGSMANLLRPGKAIQVSLQDNRWLRDKTLELPCILKVQNFLADLLELPKASDFREVPS